MMTFRCIGWLGVLSLLAVPCLAQSKLRAYYNDDFILETEDGDFQLRIRGNLHVDSRVFHSENRGAPHTIDIRRARFDFQGRLYNHFTFRLQSEFQGTPYIRNAWADVELHPAFHVRLGQMKVPFSTSWATLDNNVNFVERGAARPAFPFFDVGAVAWGELWDASVVYSLGVFNSAGTELQAPAGDGDDHKELVARLFLQPFRGTESAAIRGLYLVFGGTTGHMSGPSPLETGGYQAADFGSAIWRWRTEQVLGTDGRVTDRTAAEIESRYRMGAELHYLRGPFVFSSEYLETRYRDVALYQDFYVGSSRTVHKQIQRGDGAVHSWSTWVSLYLTGESKRLENSGWRTARPGTTVGSDGPGAWEVLARYSRTWTDRALFTPVRVTGLVQGSPDLPGDYTGTTPGAGNSVAAAILDGAHDAHELTVGLNWSVNPMVRIQLNDVFIWAPQNDRTGDGQNDNFFASGARSSQTDSNKKSRKTGWENAVMLRFILKF